MVAAAALLTAKIMAFTFFCIGVYAVAMLTVEFVRYARLRA